MPLKDLTGHRFGFLTVVSRGKSRNGISYWNCICDCGKETTVARTSLVQGHTKSCGCYRDKASGERIGNIRRTHGMTNTRLYTIWESMRARCNNPNNQRYNRYGGRGIKICKEWETFEGFRDWALASLYQDGLSIERIDFNGDYEPKNCKWIPKNEQAKNTSANRRVTINGQTRNLSDWARLSGIELHTIRHRIEKGYPESEWLVPPGELPKRAMRDGE